MAKKPNLATLRQAAGGKLESERAPEKPVEAQERVAGGQVRKSKEKPSRGGKTLVGGHFAPEVAKQLRILAAEQDKTNQQLIGEALNHLFAAYGKPEIADTERADRSTGETTV